MPENIMSVTDSSVTVKTHSLDTILENSRNIAAILDEVRLDSIARQVIADFKIDRESMSEWLTDMEKAIDLASQTIKPKNEPWQGASNIKHSLILEACIQFNARAYPEIIRDDKVVNSKVIGKDPDGSKARRAARTDMFMNAQLMHIDNGWEADLDRMLMMLSMMGTVYKKTIFDPVTDMSSSVLCFPDKVTINQNVKSLEKSRRITHEIELFPSDVTERVTDDLFLDVKLKEIPDAEQPDNDQPMVFLEQMRYIDLDGDGYPEPYCVTVHETSEKVVRITPCFNDDSVTYKAKKSGGDIEVIRIRRIDYFADFHFIHSIDGTFMSYGFGYLLSHGAHTINTLLNQLTDAGTLANLQSGFLGKGARMPGGTSAFRPGEWKRSDASGAVLKDNIVPLPTKEPSGTLFSLVQFLLDSYYRMISLSDIMSGQVAGSNTTAAEAMQAAEQGMKVMNGVYKRIYRGLRKEFIQLYSLNHEYLSDEYYSDVIEEDASVDKDFTLEGINVLPVADSSMGSQMEEMMRMRTVIDMLPMLPEINRIQVGRRLLTAMRVENLDQILPEQDPNQPSPQQQEYAAQLEQQAKDLQLADREMRVKEGELRIKGAKLDFELAKLLGEVKLLSAKAASEEESVEIDRFMAQVSRLREEANMVQALTPDHKGASNASERDSEG